MRVTDILEKSHPITIETRAWLKPINSKLAYILKSFPQNQTHVSVNNLVLYNHKKKKVADGGCS